MHVHHLGSTRLTVCCLNGANAPRYPNGCLPVTSYGIEAIKMLGSVGLTGVALHTETSCFLNLSPSLFQSQVIELDYVVSVCVLTKNDTIGTI